MSRESLVQQFRDRFHKDPDHLFFCPGRVNLIGEHIDYNGGRVMPCAISLGVSLAASKNIDKKIRFHCVNFPETAELHLQSSWSKSGKEWFNYPLGVINELVQREFPVSGLDLLYEGNLPIGAGLSSSASIEVLTGFALREMFGMEISRENLAILSKKAENDFIGVNCGIMDQFAVAMGKKDCSILLDCDSLDYEYLPFATGEYSLVVINTNKQRTLADSKYNERFAECGAALTILKQEMDIRNLCEADRAGFELHRNLFKDPVLEKRALHVISENGRVNDAVIALQTGDLEIFGKLMYASHQSLRDNYEVSCKELDTIVDFCKANDNCIGARMTGAGFGGCAIALIAKKSIHDFTDELTAHYHEMVGYKPDIFQTSAEAAVRRI